MKLFLSAVWLTASLSLFAASSPLTFCNPAAGWERLDCIAGAGECRWSCGNRPACFQEEEACPAEIAPGNGGCYCLQGPKDPFDPFPY